MCVLWSGMWSVWWMYRVSLKRMYNLLLLDEVVFRCLLYPAGRWWFSSSSAVFLLILCLLDLSISGGMLREQSWSLQLWVDSSTVPGSFLPHTFWCPFVGCIHIKIVMTLYHYVMPLFIPDNFPCSEPHVFWR